MPSRAEELARAFAKGELPEQNGRAPLHVWCEDCRGKGRVKTLNDKKLLEWQRCAKCGGRGALAQ